jgi:GT2 family glycosyltransferase
MESSFLGNIYEAIKNKDHIYAVQPKVLRMNSEIIDTVGIALSRNRRFYDVGSGQPDNGQFAHQSYVFGACSAAALYRKEMLEEIRVNGEYFDEDFFFLVEDVDLAWRAQRRGWKTLYTPEAKCRHIRSFSNKKTNYVQYLCFRNRYFLMVKNNSLRDIFKNIFFILPYDSLRFLYFLMTNRYAVKALRELIIMLPKMLRKRREICNIARI